MVSISSALYLFISTLLFGAALHTARADVTDAELERRILDALIGKGQYEAGVRPNGTQGDAIVVKLEIYILDIGFVDDTDNEFTSTMYLRQMWTDSRLVYDDTDGRITHLIVNDVSSIWKPDLFFVNERMGNLHNIASPNQFIRISPNGEVVYSIRITETLKCSMDLTYFPMDTQTCSMVIESYSHYDKTLKLEWSKDEAVTVSDSVHLPLFDVEEVSAEDCGKTNTKFGAFSCLRVDVTMSRKLGHYFINVYVPLCCIVLLSWTSFWINRSLMYVRMAVLLTLLMLAFLLNVQIRDSFPTASYSTAADVWTGMCLMFVLAAFVEFLLASTFQKDEEEKQQRDEENVPVDAGVLQEDTTGQQDGKKGQTKQTKVNIRIFQRYLKKYPSRSQRFDIASRILFPVLFAFFNIVYWCVYTQGGSPQPEDM